MSINLHASPLQGFTNYQFRNAFHQHFGGVDTFYAPYIKLKGKLDIKSSYKRDLLPENNTVPELIPQVMSNDPKSFLYVVKFVKEMGYHEINWNLGCPYPMVAKRGLGSGLLAYPTKIREVLNEVFDKSDIAVSVKLRLGYDDASEILPVLETLNHFPIKNIAIHPRIGKQLYKGLADQDAFEKCVPITKHLLIYNGDIQSIQHFENLHRRFPNINNWMIGRGVLSNPFLPSLLKNGTQHPPENWVDTFAAFHQALLNEFAQTLSGSSHIFMKIQPYWEYFSYLFPEAQKQLKKIKKSKGLKSYEEAVDALIRHAKTQNT